MTRRLGPLLEVTTALVLLAGCAARPYPVAADRTLEVPEEEGSRAFGLCYNAMMSDETEILAEARLQCEEGELVRKADDTLWTPCGLFQLSRANFVCRSPPAESSAP